MTEHHSQSPDHLTIQVERREDPVSQVTEADALLSSERYPNVVVRGPLFGYAEQRAEDRPRWRLLNDPDTGFPQDARDELNSHLWFRAKDDTDDRAERRRLLDAVAQLETEPVNEVSVGSTRYRVVRADEFARIGPTGLEPPRPTDPESDGWDRNHRSPCRTRGFVIDHAAAVSLTEGVERMALLALSYTSQRFPADVRADSQRAVHTHPGVVLLPPAFRVLEQEGDTWSMVTGQFPTPQDARRSLASYLVEFLPKLEELTEEETAGYARAAEGFTRRQRPNELTALGRHFQVVRVERMVRIGPDGPEPPRPSDVDQNTPMRIHPVMDEDGNIVHV